MDKPIWKMIGWMGKWKQKYGNEHPECIKPGHVLEAEDFVRNMNIPEYIEEIRRIKQNMYNQGFVDGVKFSKEKWGNNTS